MSVAATWALSVYNSFNAAVSIRVWGVAVSNRCSVFLALSILSGTTVAGHGDESPGTDSTDLDSLAGIHVTEESDLYVVEYGADRVRRFPDGSRNGTVVAGTGSWGSTATQLDNPSSVAFDEVTHGIYVADAGNQRIQFFPNNSTVGITVAGAGGDLGDTYGVRLDSMGNVYASDASNSRVTRWSPNSTVIGTIVAGGTKGPGLWSLDTPRQIDFDPTYTFLYVADKANHRVQQFNLLNASAVPVTVAGGNGPGSAANQLKNPISICVSQKSGALYIADGSNNRIQRWAPGSSAGVTVAGSPTGASGSTATLLSYPAGVALDANETFLYASDFNNNRVQRFSLI